ncbi:hypothetical protein N7488_008882 [Penicillium malachiteum]|nr:hypothetical protein N7488_008882 [Penicillium malachiteum]
MQFNFFILGAILATSSLVVGQGNAAAGATNMQPAGYSDGSSGDASSYSSESNGGGGSAGVSGGGGSATGDGSSGIIFGLVVSRASY